MSRVFHVIADAINAGNQIARDEFKPQGIAFARGQGWVIYDLLQGTEHEPEFVCFGFGHQPVPLSETAAEVWFSLIKSRMQGGE